MKRKLLIFKNAFCALFDKITKRLRKAYYSFTKFVLIHAPDLQYALSELILIIFLNTIPFCIFIYFKIYFLYSMLQSFSIYLAAFQNTVHCITTEDPTIFLTGLNGLVCLLLISMLIFKVVLFLVVVLLCNYWTFHLLFRETIKKFLFKIGLLAYLALEDATEYLCIYVPKIISVILIALMNLIPFCLFFCLRLWLLLFVLDDVVRICDVFVAMQTLVIKEPWLLLEEYNLATYLSITYATVVMLLKFLLVYFLFNYTFFYTICSAICSKPIRTLGKKIKAKYDYIYDKYID